MDNLKKEMGLLQEKCAKYTLPQEFMKQGIYPYFREIEGKQGTEVRWRDAESSCSVRMLIQV